MLLEPQAWLALAPVAGLTSDCLSHLILSRLTRGRKLLFSFAASFLLGTATTLAITLTVGWEMSVVDLLANLLLNAIAFVALAFGYFNFVNLNISSIRIRVLQEILADPAGRSTAQILAQYNAREMVITRLERMIYGKQILRANDRVFARRSLYLVILRIMNLLKLVMLGRAYMIGGNERS